MEARLDAQSCGSCQEAKAISTGARRPRRSAPPARQTEQPGQSLRRRGAGCRAHLAKEDRRSRPDGQRLRRNANSSTRATSHAGHSQDLPVDTHPPGARESQFARPERAAWQWLGVNPPLRAGGQPWEYRAALSSPATRWICACEPDGPQAGAGEGLQRLPPVAVPRCIVLESFGTRVTGRDWPGDLLPEGVQPAPSDGQAGPCCWSPVVKPDPPFP